MNEKIQSQVSILPFSAMDDTQVRASLKQYKIGLTVEEARKVSELLKRDPTLTEAVLWGIQGSEHCSYKSSRRFLKGFLTDGKHIILGPVEDSGIVAITDGPKGKRWGLVISHESHNKPSQVVPFEGSATGIGGCVRDIVCMGARVIGCLDLLRLGDLRTEETRTIAREVVRGIGGYGNPLGIPNLGGDTVFDAAYNNQCLVNAVALGIVREDEIIHSYVPDEAGKEGYDIIIVGKATDRSGFGGAAFASATLEKDKKERNTGAVQEPNPFLERHLLASTYALFDWLAAEKKLDKVSCKDLGAGGVVCASVEQVADKGFGANIQLENVHTALDGLPPEVIACAETQERLCWICHPDLTDHILSHYNETWDLPSVATNARASVVGKVTEDNTYRLRFHGTMVVEAKATDITCGLQYVRPTTSKIKENAEPAIRCEGASIELQDHDFQTTIDAIFRAMIESPNGKSKASLFKHYDKNVIGNTVVEAGEADAGVIAPLQNLASYVHEGTHPDWNLSDEDAWKGVAIAGDGNGRYGRISPYLQGLNAAVEAICNVAAVGASPRALTDCLNYGNPEIPEELSQLEEGVKGIAEAGRGISVEGEPIPVISGNVSLYNGSSLDPTAIVSCVGILSDARKACTMRLKQENSHLVLVGARQDECGGSLYYETLETLCGAKRDALLGSNVPHPSCETVTAQIACVTRAIDDGCVLASHDISDGGLLMTLFEMTLPQRKQGGIIGANVDITALGQDMRNDTLLFSQTGGFVLEVPEAKKKIFDTIASDCGVNVVTIGRTTSSPTLQVRVGNTELLNEKLSGLHAVHTAPIKGM